MLSAFIPNLCINGYKIIIKKALNIISKHKIFINAIILKLTENLKKLNIIVIISYIAVTIAPINTIVILLSLEVRCAT